MTYSPTPLTTSLRRPENLGHDAATIHAVLDEGYICHLGYISDDGRPRVLPTAYARVGDTVYLHGSTGSRAFLTARPDGLDVCLTVTIHDGIVFSRSWFHHSANYRSVMAHGRAVLVTDPTEKRTALAAIVDSLAPGRSTASRPPTDKELSQTAVLALPLREVSVRQRSGGPGEEPDDAGLPFWAGQVPLVLTPQPPVPHTDETGPVPAGLPGR